MRYSSIKKFFLSICCALLLIIYVPVACIVGNDTDEANNIALAQTETFETEELTEIIEFQDSSEQENVRFDEIK